MLLKVYSKEKTIMIFWQIKKLEKFTKKTLQIEIYMLYYKRNQ